MAEIPINYIDYFVSRQFLNSHWSTNVGHCGEIMLGNLLHTSELDYPLRSAKCNTIMSLSTSAPGYP